jgi:hypothetical protein
MAMPVKTTNLFLLEDLEDSGTSGNLADSDLRALHTVADWIKSFIVRPNEDLGRAGPVCPFTAEGLERKTLWLAPEPIAGRSATDVVQLLDDYKELLLRAQPTQGDDLQYKAILVVLTDLSADRATAYVNDVQIHSLTKPWYAHDGVVLDPKFNEMNDGSAIHNPRFHPFRSPVPFFLMRHAVISDWMFFLDDDDWRGPPASHGGTLKDVLGNSIYGFTFWPRRGPVRVRAEGREGRAGDMT